MSDQSSGPGYWQASDGKWYSPESHPDAIALAAQAAQMPAAPPTPLPQSPPAPDVHSMPAPQQVNLGSDDSGDKTPFFRRKLVLASIGLVAIIGIAIAATAGGGDDDLAVDTTQADNTSSAAPTDGASDDAGDGAEVDSPTTTTLDIGDAGSINAPWSFDSLSPIVFDTWGDADGSKWNATISPVRDVTSEILAASDFNEPPPDGVVYASFDASLMLIEAGKEPLSVGFNFQWEFVGGSTSSVYDASTIETENFGCGSVPDSFDDYAETFAGGTLTGTLCIPLPAEDMVHPGTRVALNFGDTRVYFAADGTTSEAYAAPAPFVRSDVSADRDGSRFAPWPLDTTTSIVFDTYGDADGSAWDIKLGAPRDVAAEVLAENSFNDPPPDGVTLVGFEVELTLKDAEVQPLSVGFNLTWEIVGGATARAYSAGTLDTNFYGCGVVPNEFDDYAEVFAGGTLTGTICIPLLTADFEHPDTEISLKFSDSRVYFGP